MLHLENVPEVNLISGFFFSSLFTKWQDPKVETAPSVHLLEPAKEMLHCIMLLEDVVSPLLPSALEFPSSSSHQLQTKLDSSREESVDTLIPSASHETMPQHEVWQEGEQN